MAVNKIGLDYFPFDIDFFSDEKVEFAAARFGIKAEIVAVKLLCKIYRNGYYTPWTDDDALMFAKRAGEGFTPSLVNEIVNELARRGFFDESLLGSFHVLTSRGIQIRYLEATERRKSVDMLQHLLLISTIPYLNVNIINQNVNIKPPDVDITKQSKGEERKEEKSKGEERKRAPTPDLLFCESEIFEKEVFREKIIGTQYAEANVDFYHETINNWSTAEGKKKKDWLAAAKNWMAKDMANGKFITNDYKPPVNGQSNFHTKQTAGKATGAGLNEAFTKFYRKQHT